MCDAMKSDPIYKQDAIDAIMGGMCSGWYCDVVERIKALPAADVAPVRHGGWEWDEEMGVFLCSSCGNGWKEQPTLMGKPLYEWCPVCGAKMEWWCRR